MRNNDYEEMWNDLPRKEYTSLAPGHIQPASVQHHYSELLRIRVCEALHKSLDKTAKKRAITIVEDILTEERLHPTLNQIKPD